MDAGVSRLSRIRSVHETWCSRSALGSPLRESWKARATHNLSSVPRAFGGRKEGVSVNSGVPAGGKALPGMPSVQSYAMAQAVCDLAVRPADSDASTPPGVGVYGIDKEKAYCFLVTQAADHYVTCFYGRIHRVWCGRTCPCGWFLEGPRGHSGLSACPSSTVRGSSVYNVNLMNTIPTQRRFNRGVVKGGRCCSWRAPCPRVGSSIPRREWSRILMT